MNAPEWSAAVIECGRSHGTIPRFGSPEWASLPMSDPRFLASVALAATCWLDHCSPERIERDAELEITANRQLENYQRSAAFAELAAGVRALASSPTEDELRARRSAVAA
jgi:hypothetical protein